MDGTADGRQEMWAPELEKTCPKWIWSGREPVTVMTKIVTSVNWTHASTTKSAAPHGWTLQNKREPGHAAELFQTTLVLSYGHRLYNTLT